MALIRKTKKNIAVIGCGKWGKNHVRVLNDKRRLHSVCDVRPYTEWQWQVPDDVGMQQNIDAIFSNPQIHGVVIATPAETHFEIALQAMELGKHVLIEKPMCMSSVECSTLNMQSRSRGVVLMVGHLLRYHPGFEEVQRLIAEKYLGELRYIYSNRLNLGQVRDNENVWWSFAPHDISMMLELAGPEVTSVWGKGWRNRINKPQDSTVTFMEFRGGVEGHIYVSWLHPVKRQELVCLCERGMIAFNDREPWERKVGIWEQQQKKEAGEKDRFKMCFEKIERSEPLEKELEEFVGCVDSAEKYPERKIVPRTSGEEGARVIEILEKAQFSMEGGK